MNDEDNFDLDIEIDGDDESTIEQKLAKLRQKNKQLTAEKSEYLAGWQRAKADYLNVERLRTEERTGLKSLITADILSNFIPLLDNFALALAHPKWNDNDSSFTKGIEFIYKDLEKIMTDLGLTKFNPLGQMFDPQTCEALESIETKEAGEDHLVLQVVKPGYMLGEKLVRPAQVKVGKLVD